MFSCMGEKDSHINKPGVLSIAKQAKQGVGVDETSSNGMSTNKCV